MGVGCLKIQIKNEIMNLLMISTLPHFLSVIPLLHNPNFIRFGYISVIVASSTFSILYHINEESQIIATIDYLLAFIWFAYDIKLGYRFRQQFFVLNGLVFLMNILIPYNKYYVTIHSIWHIISALKCLYISYSISSLFTRTDGVVAAALA